MVCLSAYMYRQISKIYRQTLTLSKCMCMRASGASELRKFWHFYILTLLFLSIFCRYSRYFVGTNDMLVGLHVPTNFLIYRQTLTLSKCMCMRLSGASELRKFWHFYILNLLFLLIFCRYIRYFVGTNDMLVGSHVPTNFQMYRQISKCTDKNPKKHYWGGSCPPAPPSGYANACITLKAKREQEYLGIGEINNWSSKWRYHKFEIVCAHKAELWVHISEMHYQWIINTI